MGQELDRIEDQVRILDPESQKVQESFASTVTARLGETDERQARHEVVTPLLHETVEGIKALSMHQDLVLEPEVIQLNEQHKWELGNREISLNLIKQEMLQHEEAQQAQDGEISELKAMVQTLMGQVKGRGKGSDLTPEASGAEARIPAPQLTRRAAVAPGGGGDPDDDEGGGTGKKPDESRKGRRDERPAPQPESDCDAEEDAQFNRFCRAITNALGQGTRVQAEPPALFQNEKHQDMRMWALTSTDYFA